jgi:hypothetical protein
MKTFKAIFTKDPNKTSGFQYSFNSEIPVSIGDHFTSDKYNTPLLVTEVLDEYYVAYDKKFNKLVKELTPTSIPLAEIHEINRYVPSSPAEETQTDMQSRLESLDEV